MVATRLYHNSQWSAASVTSSVIGNEVWRVEIQSYDQVGNRRGTTVAAVPDSGAEMSDDKVMKTADGTRMAVTDVLNNKVEFIF